MINKVDRLIVEKAVHADVEEIQRRMNVFEELESLDAYRKKMLPRIQQFTILVDKMEKSHENMRNVIQSFDENLSIKANKSTVQESITALDERFVF